MEFDKIWLSRLLLRIKWDVEPDHHLTHLSLTILLELLLVVWIWEIILQYHGQIICHIYIHIQLLSFIWPACLWPSCSTYWWSLLTLPTCPSSSCPGSPMDNHSWKMEPLNLWGGADLKHLILIVPKKYKKCWKTWKNYWLLCWQFPDLLSMDSWQNI